jgi:hypothetical protein
MTRNGKIARMPVTVRDELNLRMENGQEGAQLLAWLNGLPAVRETLQASFEGARISKQNLSEWRQGGFREWQLRREWIGQAGELEASANEMRDVVDTAALPGALAGMLAARYAALLNSWDGEPDRKFEEKLRLLRGLNRDSALLQRTIQQACEQEKKSERETEESERREREERKQRRLNMIWSVTQRGSLVRAFGGGQQGERMADIIEAVENDRPLSTVQDNPKEEGKGKKEENGSHPAKSQPRGQTRSKPVKPVKASQTESSPDMPSDRAEVSALPDDSDAGREARPAAREGETEQHKSWTALRGLCAPRKQGVPEMELPAAQEGGGMQPGQTESNPVKPEKEV